MKNEKFVQLFFFFDFKQLLTFSTKLILIGIDSSFLFSHCYKSVDYYLFIYFFN